jgi:FkbM family methyltransferase
MSRRRPGLADWRAIARLLLPDSVYRSYRRRKIAAEIAHYTPREVRHRYGRHELRVRLEDPLAEGWYDHDWREPSFITFMRDRGALSEGAAVFDLGAHQAVVALMLAREVGGAGSVVAVEAEAHNVRVARANCELNQARNVTVLYAAAGSADGATVSFAEGLNGRVGKGVEVPTVTVDALARRHSIPDAVLIDVEGYELEVLKGAGATVANQRTTFLVEVHETLGEYGATPQAIVTCFEGLELFVAASDADPFTALDTSVPEGRFFLAAVPSG